MALIIDTNPQLLPTAPTWADFANGAFEQVGRPTVGRHVCWLRRNLEFIWVRRQWVRAGPAWHTGYFRLVHSITILTVPPSSLSSSLVSLYTSTTAFKLTYDHSAGQDFPDETMMVKNKGQNHCIQGEPPHQLEAEKLLHPTILFPLDHYWRHSLISS